MRVVGLLVIVWLIVGAIAALPAPVLSPTRTELCQRGDDRVDRRRTAVPQPITITVDAVRGAGRTQMARNTERSLEKHLCVARSNSRSIVTALGGQLGTKLPGPVHL